MESIDGVKQLSYLCLFAILSTDLLLAHGQSIETIPRDVTASEGQSVDLLCRTNSPLTYCRFKIPGEENAILVSEQWKNKHPLYKYHGEGLDKGFCGLTIPGVRRSHNGPVECFLGIQDVEIHSQIELTVALAPQLPKIKMLTEMHRGAYEIDREIQAICESRDGRPPAHLSWFLDDEPITEGLSTPTIHDALTAPNTTLYTVQQTLSYHLKSNDDRKSLICRATHPAGHPQEDRVQLQVRYRPLPQQEIFVYGLNLGETALINVTINANPLPRIEWSVDGVALPQGRQENRYESYPPSDLGNGVFNVTLSIAGLTVEDTAKTYYLKASNELGLTDYLVHITSSPRSSQTSIDFGTIVGIIIGVVILLVIISVIVFARATGKWCFSGRSDEKPVTSETSDTESHVYADKSEKRKFTFNFNLNNLFKSRSEKGNSSQSNENVEEGNVSNDEDDNAAPSESTVIVEDEPTKKDGKNLVYAELVLKQSDEPDAKVSKNTTEYAEIVYKPNADKPTEETKK